MASELLPPVFVQGSHTDRTRVQYVCQASALTSTDHTVCRWSDYLAQLNQGNARRRCDYCYMQNGETFQAETAPSSVRANFAAARAQVRMRASRRDYRHLSRFDDRLDLKQGPLKLANKALTRPLRRRYSSVSIIAYTLRVCCLERARSRSRMVFKIDIPRLPSSAATHTWKPIPKVNCWLSTSSDPVSWKRGLSAQPHGVEHAAQPFRHMYRDRYARSSSLKDVPERMLPRHRAMERRGGLEELAFWANLDRSAPGLRARSVIGNTLFCQY